MNKNLKISLLYDFYKELLTEKQADVIDLYYNQDLSLSEISEHLNITRQGVRDSIKRGEKILLESEERLGLVKRFILIQKKVQKVNHIIQEIEQMDKNEFDSKDLRNKINIMKNILAEIIEKV
jgi:hypothetical protein